MQKILRCNRIASVIIIILMISTALPLFALPTGAITTSTVATYAFIDVMPSTVGIGQTCLLDVGIPDYLMSAGDGWNVTVTVTKPNNTTETLGPIKTDSTGSTGVVYTPDEVGNYTFQTNFPAQWYNATSPHTYYEASVSPIITLVVQEEPITYYPSSPLPTDFWTRPINAQLREWYVLAGNWLVQTPILPTDNLYAPYNAGPETAHILWTKPVGDTMGGLAGGVDESGYGIGDAYEGKWGGCIISGVLFYNKYDANSPEQAVVAVDLHTGQTLWTRTLGYNGVMYGSGRISFGQVLRFESYDYQGDFSYLWVTSTSGTTWYAFEPLTGDWKFNMTNVPSGTNYYGPNGEILRYTVDSKNGWMTQWNTTSAAIKGNTGFSLAWGSQVSGKSFNAQTKGYDWNVTIPKGLPGSVETVTPEDRVIGASITSTSVTIWALSLKPGQEGTLLYNTTWAAPSAWVSGNQTISWSAASTTDNVAVLYSKELDNYYGFSLTTGQFIWGPTPSENYLNIYDHISTINYDRLVSSGCSGIINCYNATTGTLLWTYTAKQNYTEFQIGNNWWLQQLFITDGKVYLGHVEHSPNQPLPRGAPFICLDIYTGKVIWEMDGGFRQTCWGGKAMIADSIIALMDTYDQREYAISKGPTDTTVTASPSVSVHGSSVLIEGTVMDVSPGTTDTSITLRFPNGVAAISDASMSDWMKYVYMQFPIPTNATGVEVSLDTFDPNGNYVHIGNATSDSTGMFSYQWVPEVPGKYTVIATFEGSNGYYGSSSETAAAVDEAAATPTPTPQAATSVADTYFIPAIAGIFVAIILLALLVVLMLRKRP
ncbi:MAG: hypothetical protein ABSA79_12895 [Candidatus Bathyarchaeia archaeon]|jgi:hypothetical protein